MTSLETSKESVGGSSSSLQDPFAGAKLKPMQSGLSNLEPGFQRGVNPGFEMQSANDLKTSRSGPIAHKTAQVVMDALHREDDVDPDGWHAARGKLYKIFRSNVYMAFISSLLVFNLMLAILETDATANSDTAPPWMNYANTALMCVYSIEMVLRVYTYRLRFFTNVWSVLDFSIVVIDVSVWFHFTVQQQSSNMMMVKTLRLVRLLRLSQSVRLLVRFPDLVLAVKGLVGALVAASWGMALVFFALLPLSIIAVKVFHPICKDIVAETDLFDNCERCGRAYESVSASLITFSQQYVAGDSWGLIIIPIIERAPWTAPIFVIAAVVLDLMLLNLILAFILDSSANARKGAEREMAICYDNNRRTAAARFYKMCEAIDKDGSGELSLTEIVEAYDELPCFQDALKSMDVVKEDMEAVFNMLDRDDSGSVDFEEFCSQLYKFKTSDTQVLLCFIRMHVSNISKMVKALITENNAILREELRALRGDGSMDMGMFAEARVGTRKQLNKSYTKHVPGGTGDKGLVATAKALAEAWEHREHNERQEHTSNHKGEASVGHAQDVSRMDEEGACQQGAGGSPVGRNPPQSDGQSCASPARDFPELLASLKSIRDELLPAVLEVTPQFKETTRMLRSLNANLPGSMNGVVIAADASWEEAYTKGSTWAQRSASHTPEYRPGRAPAEPLCSGHGGEGRVLEDTATGQRRGAPELGAGSGESNPAAPKEQASGDSLPPLTHVYV